MITDVQFWSHQFGQLYDRGSQALRKAIKSQIKYMDNLKKLFETCAKVKSASISKKKDLHNLGNMLSMGYGFVEFKYPDGAMRAIQSMQKVELDGHSLELKISNKISLNPRTSERKKKQKEIKQKTTKILVRNIPFEAKRHEVEELFKVFGEIKSCRLQKKMTGIGSHRGFDLWTFSLCMMLRLYVPRLVLEWANTEDDVDEIRKRTADNCHDDGGKKFTKSGLVESLEGTMAGEMGL